MSRLRVQIRGRRLPRPDHALADGGHARWREDGRDVLVPERVVDAVFALLPHLEVVVEAAGDEGQHRV